MSEPAYKNLLTYKYAVFIYDMNKEFIARFVSGMENMRQRQQMDQAARSSKQCIVEGAMQGTSLKGYIKMLGVSRGSWEKLLEEKFLKEGGYTENLYKKRRESRGF